MMTAASLSAKLIATRAEKAMLKKVRSDPQKPSDEIAMKAKNRKRTTTASKIISIPATPQKCFSLIPGFVSD